MLEEGEVLGIAIDLSRHCAVVGWDLDEGLGHSSNRGDNSVDVSMDSLTRVLKTLLELGARRMLTSENEEDSQLLGDIDATGCWTSRHGC